MLRIALIVLFMTTAAVSYVGLFMYSGSPDCTVGSVEGMFTNCRK